MTETKVMICMRKDLNLRKGKMIGQAGHGIQYMILDHLFVDTEHPRLMHKHLSPTFLSWLEGDHTKVTVGIDSYATLQKLAKSAAAAGIPAYIVEDSGKTELPALTQTCLILGPAPVEELDKLTGKYELL